MARQRKFPIPHTDKEIPYDSEGFIKWCVNNQGLSINTAKKYALDVKTAYLTIFEDDDKLFDNIKVAFTPRPSLNPNHPMETLYNRLFFKWADMEDEYDNIFEYINVIENLDEFGPIMIETTDGGEAPLPKEDWVRAFNAYMSYIRWKINDICVGNCMPFIAPYDTFENRVYFSLPLAKEFNVYLRSIHRKQDPGWKPHEKSKRIKEHTYQGENASYTYISRLTKIYNVLLPRYISILRIANILDKVLRMKVPVWEHCDIMFKRIDRAREYASADFLSDSDIACGRAALHVYIDFMKAYSLNPEAYQPKSFRRRKSRKD